MDPTSRGTADRGVESGVRSKYRRQGDGERVSEVGSSYVR